MKDCAFDIMHENTKIGQAMGYISCDGFEVYDFTLSESGPFSTEEIFTYYLTRAIPANRGMIQTLPALMQIPKYHNRTRPYGVYYTFAAMNYCASLTDRLWINPQEDFWIYFYKEFAENSKFKGMMLHPVKSYDEVDFWKVPPKEDVRRILSWNFYQDFAFEDVDYRAPDFTTYSTGWTYWTWKEPFDYWFEKIETEQLDRLDEYVSEKREEYEEAKKNGVATPKIEKAKYGIRTSCLSSPSVSCFATIQIMAALHERDPRKAEEKFAERFGLPIKGWHERKNNCGLLFDGKQITRAIW